MSLDLSCLSFLWGKHSPVWLQATTVMLWPQSWEEMLLMSPCLPLPGSSICPASSCLKEELEACVSVPPGRLQGRWRKRACYRLVPLERCTQKVPHESSPNCIMIITISILAVVISLTLITFKYTLIRASLSHLLMMNTRLYYGLWKTVWCSLQKLRVLTLLTCTLRS